MSANDKTEGASFLSRWSKKKIDAKNDAPAETKLGGDTGVEPNVGMASDASISASNSSIDGLSKPNMPETPHPEPSSAKATLPDGELPSIETLTHEADFSPFMAKGVDPSLRNQAMKKLFADPHYGFDNMDKLDIYLDDYSKFEPLPLEIVKQMYQSRSLFLFDDDEDEEKKKAQLASTQSAATPAHPITRPGLSTPAGSSMAFSRCISAISVALLTPGSRSRFRLPMPCSAEIDPP